MDLQGQIEQLRTSLLQAERIQMELDRRVYYLKTLYDISKDIFGSVEYEKILKNFLMMTMGNFGVAEGFILTVDVPSRKITGFVSVGFQSLAQGMTDKAAEVWQTALKEDPDAKAVKVYLDFIKEKEQQS